jgi:hypothetical protein
LECDSQNDAKATKTAAGTQEYLFILLSGTFDGVPIGRHEFQVHNLFNSKKVMCEETIGFLWPSSRDLQASCWYNS